MKSVRPFETEIKLHTSQFWPVFTMASFILLFIGAGINSVFIKRYNRYHAIARGQYHSPLVGNEPVRAMDRRGRTQTRRLLAFTRTRCNQPRPITRLLHLILNTVCATPCRRRIYTQSTLKSSERVSE